MSDDKGRFLTSKQRTDAIAASGNKCQDCGVEDGGFYVNHEGAIRLTVIHEESKLTGMVLSVYCEKCRKNYYTRRRNKTKSQKRRHQKRESSGQLSMFDDTE